MRILVFTSFGSMNGGANKALFFALKTMKERFNTDFFVIMGSKGVLCDKLNDIGIKWKIVSFHKMAGVKSLNPRDLYRLCRYNIWMIKDYLLAKQVVKTLNSNSFDSIYINDTTPYFGAIIGRMLNIPYIWHFRTLVEPTEHYALFSKRLFADAKAIIAISNCMKALIEKNRTINNNHIVMIYDGVEHRNAKPSKQDLSNGLHIVECGRLTEDKGHIDGIRALAWLKDQGYDNVYLHIVGQDPSKGASGYVRYLNKLISENGLSERVIFEGYINTMSEFRENMNCELMCSRGEPFGWVTVEGMRSGLVVIGANCGATPEIVNDYETGIIYNVNDYVDLGKKIIYLIKNPEKLKKIAQNARIFAHSRFDIDTNAEQIEALLT